jgi:hypothetical protein
MKILTVLTYYRPHTSGLTIYAERLAVALAQRGHQVTVMTTQYDKSLLPEEMMSSVRVIRIPVALRISKGVIAPTFGLVATRLVAENDAVILHLPQFDAPGVALRARLMGKLVLLTYHCDLHLPHGIINCLVNFAVKILNNLAAMLSNRIITYTQITLITQLAIRVIGKIDHLSTQVFFFRRCYLAVLRILQECTRSENETYHWYGNPICCRERS